MARVDEDVVTDEMGLMVGFQAGDDVEALLTDRHFSAVAMTTLGFSGVTDGPLYDLWSLLMFGKDGDEHRRLRKPVAPEFTPAAVEHYRPDIQRFAEDLADRLSGNVDIWSEFAVPLASRSACRVVGIPDDDADVVGRWAIDLVGAFFLMDDGMRQRAEAAAIAFTEYLDGHAESTRATSGDNVTSRLLGPDVGHDLTSGEIRALVANLVFGGLEATAKVITTGLYHLVTEDQWDTLVAKPDNVAHAVSELLRFSPPIGPARVVAEGTIIRDVPMTAGQMAILDVAGACRDPRRYENPEDLDIDREPGRQLAFGAGPHFCLGANLAKVVLEVAFATLATRFPDLTLAGDSEAKWDHETFHGIVELHVATQL